MATEHFAAIASDREVADAVADHKSRFFIEKNASGTAIDYRSAVSGSLKIVPEGEARTALEADYTKMIEDRVLLRDPLPFEKLMTACLELERRVNQAARTMPAR